MIGRSMRKLLIALALAGLAAGCAGQQPRFDTADTNLALTPQQAAAQASAVGRRVLWGGTIVNASNLTDRTQLEVLAYPLDDDQRPRTDLSPIGRFLAVRDGYLETADYAPGRQVTVAGTVEGTSRGQVGQADYTYPLLRVDDIQLWPREPRYRSGVQPRFGVGIGISIGR